MVVTIKNNAIVLRYPDILYIEVRGHNLRIKTASNAQALEVRGQLRDIMVTLPAELFVRCHRLFPAGHSEPPQRSAVSSFPPVSGHRSVLLLDDGGRYLGIF